MIPAANALLSMLTLKLLDKERLSHIDDFNCDEALGRFNRFVTSMNSSASKATLVRFDRSG